ncbi:MAG: hypothetical protein Q9225_006352 [Loekoesia sp. 1 TL-2023]
MSGRSLRPQGLRREEQARSGSRSRSPAGPSVQQGGNEFTPPSQQGPGLSTTAGATPRDAAGQGGLSPHWIPMPRPGGHSVPQPNLVIQGPQQRPQPVVGPFPGAGATGQPQHPDLSGLAGIRMTDLPDASEQSEHRTLCRQLAQEIIQANRNAGDRTLQSFLRRRFYNVPGTLRPSKKHISSTLLAFFQLTFWNMDARGALAWMINSHWNFGSAVEAYMNRHFEMDGAPGSELVPGMHGSEGPSAERPGTENTSSDENKSDQEAAFESYADEDPENIGRNIPDDVVVETYNDPDTGEEEPCVYHERIRQHLINEAATQGSYRYHREGGSSAHDKTSYLKSQRNWGFKDRGQYPPITFVFKRKGRTNPKYPNDEIPLMRWRGLLVIDHHGVPIRRFHNIPATLSSQMEGGLIEAIFRQDSRIENSDLLARMPQQWSKPKAGGEAACIYWYGRTHAVKPFDRFLRDNLPDALKDANNTRGLARNLHESEINKMKQSHQLAQALIIDFDLVDEFPSSSGERARSAYHPEEEHDCRDCMPRNLDDLAALNDAILITAMDFIEGTGMCPRLPFAKKTYNELYTVIVEQLRSLFAGTRRRRPRLRKIGRWTGGIKRWRSGAVV